MMYSNLIQALFICILLKEFRMEELDLGICKEHCECFTEGNKPSVVCYDINENQLQRMNEELAGKELNLLEIDGSTFGNFTKGILSGIKAEAIRMLDVDTHSFEFPAAFHGMQDTLKSVIFGLPRMKTWIFSSGEGFHKLEVFRMVRLRHHSANPFIRSLPRNMIQIRIQSCVIDSLENSSFARFDNLTELSMDWSTLSSFERRFLPRPATHLKQLSLMGIPITSLPDDMFDEMPALMDVNLVNTRLTTLPYRAFEPVFRQLKSLQLHGISLDCDCDAAWLLKRTEVWKDSYATCNAPVSLKYHNLLNLMPLDMCYNCKEHFKNKNYI